jgi:hypothetical protein
MEEKILSYVATAIAALLGKYFWDRYLSKDARVTKEVCHLSQEACKNNIMAEIKLHTDRLAWGNEEFAEMKTKIMEVSMILSVTSFAIFELCRANNISCEEIVKLLSKKGIIE